MRDDAVLSWMKSQGIPLTRKNYMDLNWLGEPPEEPLDAELEASVPTDQLIDDLNLTAEDALFLKGLAISSQ